MPADGGSPAVRNPAAAAEDPPRRDDRALMAVQLAKHVPQTAPNDGVEAAARSALGHTIFEVKDHVGEITLTVRREAVVDVLRTLRDTPGLEYQQMVEIAGCDYPERAERFEVNYHLLSLT